MKSFPKLLSGVVLIAAGVAMYAPSPDASNSRFVIINNDDYFGAGQGDNYGSIMKLESTMQKPRLDVVAKLDTGQMNHGELTGNNLVVVQNGSNICMFLTSVARSGTNAITSFVYPSLMEVGNYVGGGNYDAYIGVTLAASDGYLYADYAGFAMGVWQIQSDCSLNMVQTLPLVTDGGYVMGMAITPDGKTIATANSDSVDTLSISPAGGLKENGPYEIGLETSGLDITADSQYVVFAVSDCQLTCQPEVTEFALNPDGTLGNGQDIPFEIGNDTGFYDLHFSPNEKFLFATGGILKGGAQVITLNFTENPFKLSYSGCVTDLRDTAYATTLASPGTTGSGTGLYVAQGDGAVALLGINPQTGCTTETSGSPFSLGDPIAYTVYLAAWPPRPF